MQATDHYVRQVLAVLGSDRARTPLVWRDRRITAGELADSITSAAEGMRRQGLGRDDVVAVLTDANTPATLILRWAVNLLGATAVHLRGVNAAFPQDQLALEGQFGILAETAPALLAVDLDNADRARELCRRLPTPPRLVALGAAGPGTTDLTAFPADAFDPADAEEGEVAVVTYTSGSTGRPKGVCWSFPVRAERAATLGREGKWESYLIIAPLTHTSGHLADATIVAGGTVVLLPGFDATEVLRAIPAHRITHLTLAAPQLYRFVDHPDIAAADLSSVRELFYTGTPAAPGRVADALRVLGPRLAQIYGTSETGLISQLTRTDHDDDTLHATVGRPVDGVRVVIRDPQDGGDLPAGEEGEVCVRAPWMSVGYWRAPALTGQVTDDGWIRTGDIGHLDERGYLRLHGRTADVVKANGIKIYPLAVEQALLDHPAVAQAVGFGVEDVNRTERFCVAVVPREGADPDVAELREHVRTRLSANHVPGEIELRPSLPLLGPGKPDRVQLRALTRDRLGLVDGAWRVP